MTLTDDIDKKRAQDKARAGEALRLAKEKKDAEEAEKARVLKLRADQRKSDAAFLEEEKKKRAKDLTDRRAKATKLAALNSRKEFLRSTQFELRTKKIQLEKLKSSLLQAQSAVGHIEATVKGVERRIEQEKGLDEKAQKEVEKKTEFATAARAEKELLKAKFTEMQKDLKATQIMRDKQLREVNTFKAKPKGDQNLDLQDRTLSLEIDKRKEEQKTLEAEKKSLLKKLEDVEKQLTFVIDRIKKWEESKGRTTTQKSSVSSASEAQQKKMEAQLRVLGEEVERKARDLRRFENDMHMKDNERQATALSENSKRQKALTEGTIHRLEQEEEHEKERGVEGKKKVETIEKQIKDLELQVITLEKNSRQYEEEIKKLEHEVRA